jgi:dTDP-4-amino-4,6-dideoxygalactose transaminase
VTEAASAEVVSLPCYPMLRDDEVDAVIAGVLA